MPMPERSRREFVRTVIAAGGAGVAVPAWLLPALAQGETVVPFLDLPAAPNFLPAPDRRLLDVRTITGPITPRDQFFTTQHYGHPAIDLSSYRLTVSGLVTTPLSLSIAEVQKMGASELVFGFECSGNRRPLQGLSSNGRWTGVPLRAVLDRAGVKTDAREFVFFGADRGVEDVDFRGNITKVEQQYGRSLPREKALAPELMLAWALNGEPLTAHQGFPLRLLVPGWYGVAHVKWLSGIHAQADPYLGKYQARWYRTLRGETINGETKWVETAVTHMNLKSFIARVTHQGGRYTVTGVVLNDGTPIKGVDVKVDDGPWQPAVLDPVTAKSKHSWKLFTFAWQGATPGEHTLVSRATDANGQVQPTEAELANKKTFLEDNSQHPRRVAI